MLRYSLFVFAIAVAVLPALSFGQYWFQTGAIGSQNTSYNSGASVSIQTIYNQNISSGSFGFWVGETLSNGAFLQVGYSVENQSGYYSTNCTVGGCSDRIYIAAGQPVWFWEYFPQNGNSSAFYGSFGKSGMGDNGTFNNYSFISSGNVWTFYMNGVALGQVDLGSKDSGYNVPFVAAEDAGTDTNTTYMIPVSFKNFRIYKYGGWVGVPGGQVDVGYGRGSETALKNNYGIEEDGNKVNYFMVGSGLPIPRNGTVLWSSGYSLSIDSAYGNNGTTNYTGLSSVQISEPAEINVSKSERILFDGWVGTGTGSYTGNSPSTYVRMYDNVAERAVWTVQYKVDAESEFGNVSGSGWYDYGSLASMSVSRNVSYENSGERYVLSSWSNNMTGNTIRFIVTGPENLTAVWEKEYLVNASTEYGSISGSGWYPYMANATLSLNFSPIQTGSGVRIGFYSWSNGADKMNYSFAVDNSVYLSTVFRNQYMSNVSVKNANGDSVNFSYVVINGFETFGNQEWLFGGVNRATGIGFDGYNLKINETFNVSGPSAVSISAPLYSVTIYTDNLFGIPLNASVYITFMNGTAQHLYTGSGGTISLKNVADGYVKGTVEFDGNAESFSRVGGGGIRVRFMSAEVLLLSFIFAVLMGLVGFLIARRHHKRYLTGQSDD